MDLFPKLMRSGTSRAEGMVFEALAKSPLGKGYYAMHSLLLPCHQGKLIGETDFLILTPEGVIIIEVKGGLIEINQDGIWTTTPRGGQRTILRESPVHQAVGNMFAVKDALEQNSLPFQYRRNLLGFGLLFPECNFTAYSIEIEKEIVLDQTGFFEETGITKFIKRLERYWRNKLGGRVQTFQPNEQERIRNWLRPQFHAVRSLRSDYNELSERMVALIDDQMDFLELAQGKKRIICRGGAGTGKTLLGLEYTRLVLEEAKDAVFIVPSPILKGYLINKGYEHENIVTIDEFEKTAIALKAGSMDCCIIDECQDIMSFDKMSFFDKCLNGGIENGSWMMLLDDQNQTGICGKFETECYEYINSFAELNFRLPRNIRNTSEIIVETKALTKRDIGRKGAGVGSVKYIEYSNDDELGNKLYHYIKSMRSCDLPLELVTVVGAGEIDTSIIVKVLKDRGFKFMVLDLENCHRYPFISEKKLTYSRVKDFKGLESYMVILDIGEFGFEGLALSSFYVAMTRAAGHLVLLYPRTLRKAIAELTTSDT